jgi:hypothetical protein
MSAGACPAKRLELGELAPGSEARVAIGEGVRGQHAAAERSQERNRCDPPRSEKLHSSDEGQE